MTRSLPLFVLVFTAGLLQAQTTVRLEAELAGCPTAPKLWAFTGFGFEPVGTFEKEAAGHYALDLAIEQPAFRYLGTKPDDLLPVIVGADDPLTVRGSCGKLRGATVPGSAINQAYAHLKARFSAFDEQFRTLQQDIEVIQDERVRREARASMAAMDAEKRDLLASMQEQYPILGRIASLSTYLSWYAADQNDYSNQLDHYLQTYFQFVDYTDPGYGDLAWTYEGYRTFVDRILQVVPAEQLAEIVLKETRNWPATSPARFLARSGALASLLPARHPAAVTLADSIAAEYASSMPDRVATMQRQVAVLQTHIVGAEAPLFAAATPEGDTLRLEELRGDVVLLDFWASWCGPCRRENPNVVRMYEKYKDRGFEILGVSLDNDRERWLKAIADDELSWLHVSDLQGWRSAYGQLYGVTSIPQTVLLDREGRILARNLRGEGLERKLDEVLGIQ